MIAKIIAWGRDRDEALARLRRALAQSTVVVEGGTTNRSFLLIAARPAGGPRGRFDNRWLDRLTAKGDHVPAPDPVALLAAAVEAYDADHAAARGRVPRRGGRAAGRRRRRGRAPRAGCATAASAIELGVYRTGPARYQVDFGADVVDLAVERLDDYERRRRVGGRHAPRGRRSRRAPTLRVDVDGTAHRVTATTAAWCAPGGRRSWSSRAGRARGPGAEGDPLAVLESMKMESHRHRAVRRRGAAVDVAANAQVERRRAAAAHPRGGRRRRPPSGARRRRSPARWPTPPPAGTPPCERGVRRPAQLPARLRPRPGDAARLLRRQRRLGEAGPPADAGLLACEDGLLDLFADVAALYRPAAETEPDDALTAGSTQEYLLSFLQWLDADRAGLPDAFRAPPRARARPLRRRRPASARPSWRPRSCWMFRSFRRVARARPGGRCRSSSGGCGRAPARPLGRRATCARGWTGWRRHRRAGTRSSPSWPATCGSATSTSRCSTAVVADVYAEMEGHLDALAADPTPPDREALSSGWSVARSRCAALLLRPLVRDARPRRAPVLLEIYARRFYRYPRPGAELRSTRPAACSCAPCELRARRQPHRTSSSRYAPLADLTAVAGAVAAHLRDVPADAKAVVDLATWRPDAAAARRRDGRPAGRAAARLRLRPRRCSSSTSR